MATKIEWTDESWNPVIGCTKVSAGCDNCYAERMAWRLRGMRVNGYWPACKEPEVVTEKGWTGEIHLCYEKIAGQTDAFCKPLHWRKPRRIFVNSMSDTFHEKVPFEFIDKIFRLFGKVGQGQHTYQILTKRPKRMKEYIAYAQKKWMAYWPATSKRVHIGVTVENQDNDWRIAELLKIPAAVRFVSIEPMLGEIYLPGPLLDHGFGFERLQKPERIDWVIIGCESGPKRRPCKLDWVRDVVRHCKMANIKVFVKQLDINGKVEKDIKKFPKDLQIRQYPKGQK